jgi:hypothetical protein
MGHLLLEMAGDYAEWSNELGAGHSVTFFGQSSRLSWTTVKFLLLDLGDAIDCLLIR